MKEPRLKFRRPIAAEISAYMRALVEKRWKRYAEHVESNQAYERARSHKVLLKFISMALDLMEREAKLLGLDAEMRNRMERPPGRTQVQPTVWSLLAKVGPSDLETLKRIQELDPIEKPDHAKGADGPGPVDD